MVARVVKTIFQKLEEPGSIHEFIGDSVPAFEIKGAEYKARYSSFTDVVFESIAHFENVDLSMGLYFNNCTFKEPLVFEDIKTNGFDMTLNPDSESIVFKNCKFQEVVLFKGKNNKLDRDLSFKDCNFEKGIEVEALNVVDGGIIFRDCSFKEKLDIFKVSGSTNIAFINNEVHCNTRLENINCSTITFIDANDFFENIIIRDSKFTNGIVFNDGLFKKEVYLQSIETASTSTGLVIVGSKFEKAIFINFHSGKHKPSVGISHFFLSDSYFQNGFYVNGTQDLLADYPSVEEISLSISAELKGNIEFRNLDVGILNLTGNNTSANIYFQDLWINQIKIKGLINNAGLIFSRIKSSYTKWFNNREKTIVRENALYIDDTNFGKAQFFQIDFSSFEKVSFHNIILTEISTSLVKWFTPIQLDSGESSLSVISYNAAKKSKDKQRIENARMSLISDYRSKQEIYRQLKFASQKQGDVTNSLVFQGHEMNYYRKIVTLRIPRNWSEHIVLWSSQTNDFGQNWLKAFKLLLLFSFISFIPIGFLNTQKLNYSEFATSLPQVCNNFKVVFCDNFNNWFLILNPAHSFKDLNEKISGISKWIYFWDLLSRIIVSYFIFQTISAFRKFNK